MAATMPMNVTYTCPKCEQLNRNDVDASTVALRCEACGQNLQIPPGAVEDHRVRRCLVCPSTDLFVRKDFPQRLGVAIVVVGFVASSVAWYGYHMYLTFGILFATALVDVLLYALVGEGLMCYRCGAMYRGFDNIEEHGAFDLEIHERHRQQVARLSQLEAGQQHRDAGQQRDAVHS